jgi:hypothetical protein
MKVEGRQPERMKTPAYVRRPEMALSGRTSLDSASHQ